MQRLTVNLVDKAMSSLKEAADWGDTTPEETFNGVVRNALRVCHVIEVSGFLRLIDGKTGEFEDIHFHSSDTPLLSLGKRIIMKILGIEQEPSAHQPFEAILHESTAEEVKFLASLYGLSLTDLYNRLVIVGSKISCHVGYIYAFNEAGDPLEKIELPLE